MKKQLISKSERSIVVAWFLWNWAGDFFSCDSHNNNQQALTPLAWAKHGSWIDQTEDITAINGFQKTSCGKSTPPKI
jgi:hypothetical protein